MDSTTSDAKPLTGDITYVHSPPILYTFRRCPYAIRARMALAYAGITAEHREVVLKNKPAELLQASAKGTVPVLVMPDGEVLDESLAIMRWALMQSDPEQWMTAAVSGDAEAWIAANDGPFKQQLDHYKYADRYPEHPADWYRDQALPHLSALDEVLRHHSCLHGDRAGLVDVALFPFIRQFAMVDYQWFTNSPYKALHQWLERWLEDPLFLSIMQKRPAWSRDQGLQNSQ